MVVELVVAEDREGVERGKGDGVGGLERKYVC